MRKHLLLLSALILLGAASSTAAAQPENAQAGATLIVRDSRYGRVLFDGRGFALYAFTRDRRGGPSRCYGACAAAWPADRCPSTRASAATAHLCTSPPTGPRTSRQVR